MTNRHLDLLSQRAPVLSECLNDIQSGFEILRTAFASRQKLLICGNGGSASDAEHWAGELLKGFRSKRPLFPEEQTQLPPEIAGKLQGALPVIPLTGFPSFATAFANDVDPDLIFSQLVWALGNPGDVLICMSTSGNARNVCSAAQVARARGLTTIALTGQSGGSLSPLCDLSIRVPATETYLIQELHLPVYHCLCLMLEDEFFAG